MNDNLSLCPRELCLEMGINTTSSRLPLIVIQTPAEVEAGLCKYWSKDDAFVQGNRENGEKREDYEDQRRGLSQEQRLGFCNFATTPNKSLSAFYSSFSTFCNSGLATGIPTFQFSNNGGVHVDACSEFRARRPSARRNRLVRNKARKNASNEHKTTVEDALLAFKKMKLHTDEDEV